MEFERQNISMSRPPLDLTHIGTNTTKEKISYLGSTPVSTKIPDPKALTRPTESSKAKKNREKIMYQRTRSHTHHHQTHHQENLIRPMTSNTSNIKAGYAI